MWPSVRLTFAAVVIVVASGFVVAFTSSYAFVRAQVERVDVDLASVIQADYSADPRGARLAPLDEEIVDVARQDVARLQETASGVEIVAVYHQPVSAAAEPEVFATPTPSRGQAPPTSTPNGGKPTASPTHGPSPGWPTAVPWPTPQPATPPPEGPSATPNPTAAPTSPSTPEPTPITTLTPGPTQTRTPTPGPTPSPSPSPTASPTRTPTASPTRTPTASPTPSRTASPTPSPTPSATPTPTPVPWNGTLYLHNNPTPPVGDTASQPELPMDAVLPVALDLYNYDVDRDASPGLTIAKGGSGPYESDPTKYQAWLTAPLPAAIVVDGTVTLKLWTATVTFDLALGAAVSVYLLDCGGSGCVELGGGTLSDSKWQHESQTWVQSTFTFPVGPYTVAPGNSLKLVVVVEPMSQGDMWFAYDTNDHKSRVTVPGNPASWVGSEAGLSPLLTRWLVQPWMRLLFA